jgi:Icc protein
MRILHLSDTHLDRTDSPNADGVNARQSLRQMLGDLDAMQGIDVIVISGDIAGDRSREAYHAARELIGEFARSRNVPMIYSTGNEDERMAFIEVLGKAQLDWLRGVLSEASPEGTVLVFHHPPIALDVEVQQALSLQNAPDLADAIRDTDVQLILCGHFHLQLFGHLESAVVCVTPGVVSRVDLTAATGTERAVRGASATIVDLGTPHSPLLHVLHARDPRAGETVYEADEREVRAEIEKLGP